MNDIKDMLVSDEVLDAIHSLIEHDRTPTDLELDRFIRWCGYLPVEEATLDEPLISELKTAYYFSDGYARWDLDEAIRKVSRFTIDKIKQQGTIYRIRGDNNDR